MQFLITIFMYNRTLVSLFFLLGMTLSIVSLKAENSNNQPPVYAWIGCDGMAVVRTEVGKIVMSHITPNLPNCNGPKNISINTLDTNTGTLVQPINTESIRTGLTASGDTNIVDTMTKKSATILLDLSQREILNYRIAMIRQQQIQYANAIRSLRVRSGKSMQSNTSGYLIRNDAVQVTGEATGWTPVRTGKVIVTDARENTVGIDTTYSTSGYAGTRYLRDATPADLVKIGQADIAYWADIVHTNVAHMVNIRVSPWYGSSIVSTISRDIILYRVATVDNWSEIESIDGTIHGFIRSDFLIVDKSQRIEIEPLLR